jgi:hypothetical protein
MTIKSDEELSLAHHVLKNYYNETIQQQKIEVRKKSPPHQLLIPINQEIYEIWEKVTVNFMGQKNCFNPQVLRKGVLYLKQHLIICQVALQFKHHLVEQKEAMAARNAMQKDVVEKVSHCKSCFYEKVSGSEHLRTIGIRTDSISSAETAAIFLKFSARTCEMEKMTTSEFHEVIRDLADLKEESDRDDVRDMCDAMTIIIQNYIEYRGIHKKWWNAEIFIENNIHGSLILNRPLLQEVSKITVLRETLLAHQELIILKDTSDLISEKRVLIEQAELNFYSTNVDRIESFFTTTDGFKKSDIQALIDHARKLRTILIKTKRQSGLKKELLELLKILYSLKNQYEVQKRVIKKQTKFSTADDTSFLPKSYLIQKKKQQPSRKTKTRTKKSRRARGCSYTHQRKVQQTPSSSSSSSTATLAQKISTPERAKKTIIWIKDRPTYPFPHHLIWDRHVFRWYHRSPDCLEEGSYKDLTPQQKTREHYSHSLPPSLDTFLNSEYSVRSHWKSSDGEMDDMYSIPSAIEYTDPHDGEEILEFGHLCTVVNPRRKVIYHRYFHRSHRQTFYRTGLTRASLRTIWAGQSQLPKISSKSSSTSDQARNNRPREDVQKLYNRVTESVVVIDKLHKLKITLFKPSQ